MGTPGKKTPPTFVTYGFVGELGCIRFPQAIRKVAGIKRGDRLMVFPDDEGVLLEKLDAPVDVHGGDVHVSGCACEQTPEQCRGPRQVVGVGWSYVQLNKELAVELGFLPETPVRLVAEPGQIIIAPCAHPENTEVERLRCPP